jgi:hypothetical protein
MELPTREKLFSGGSEHVDTVDASPVSTRRNLSTVANAV